MSDAPKPVMSMVDQIITSMLVRDFDIDYAEADIWVDELKAELLAAGYAIELDEAALLRKGEKLWKPVKSGVEPEVGDKAR